MESLPLPSKCVVNTDAPDHATVVVEPLYPGYGTTVGNALRRVLLSSLPGAAVTAAKIGGVTHEFTTLPHVKEDMVALVLNLKQLRFRLHGDEPQTAILKVKGDKIATGADLTLPSNLELVNTDQIIATLTDKAASLELELTVAPGRGYVPVESREKEKLDLGTIAVDAIYTPVRNVNFDVEHVRVGQMTNYDRLTLDIRTDGTITPAHAVHAAATMLVDHFSFVMTSVAEVAAEPAPAAEEAPKKRKASKRAEKVEKEAEE